MLKRVLMSTAAFAIPGAATMAVAARSEVSPASEPHFVTLSEVQVPVIDGGRMTGRLSFDIVIDAVDEAAAIRVATAAPRLRSASIAAGIEFSRLYVSGLTPVDAGILSRDITVALRQHDPDIGRVLIVKVAAQPA